MNSRANVETELGRFRLPVSERMVALRQPGGAEDLMLLEAAPAPNSDTALALALASRLAHAVEGDAIGWDNLPVTDLDALILRLRQALIGDRVRADVACLAPGCGQRIDIEFGIEQFLTHHTPQTGKRPNRGWAFEPAEEPGWYCLVRTQDKLGSPASDAARPTSTVREPSGEQRGPARVSFRLPTAADQLAVIGCADSAAELARRCIRPADVPGPLRRRAEAAMAALAPSLSCDLEGVCPECRATVTVHFDARWFCLRELRDRAAFIYQDVDILARRYHWSEREILAMPHVRRVAYAELARQVGGA